MSAILSARSVILGAVLAFLPVHGFGARIEIMDAAQPQLAADGPGNVWLAYGRVDPAPAVAAGQAEHGGKKGGHGHGGVRPAGEVFVARSVDGGTSFSSGTSLGRLPNLMLGNRRGPRIAARGDHVTVTVMSEELRAFSSSDGGRSWSGPTTINDVPGSAREGLHDLAIGPDGGLFVTWLDLRNGRMELWGAFSRDGGRTWSSDAQVYQSPDKSICECCHPTALFDGEGNLAVMWRNSIGGARDMWLAVRRKGAKAFSPAQKLGQGTWTLNACPMDGGDLVALGGGRFGAVWQRNGEVFLTRDSGAETKLGKGRQPVAVPRRGQPALLIWQNGAALILRRGEAEAPETLAADGRFASVASLPGGTGTVVAYERGAKGATTVVVERL